MKVSDGDMGLHRRNAQLPLKWTELGDLDVWWEEFQAKTRKKTQLGLCMYSAPIFSNIRLLDATLASGQEKNQYSN